MNWIPTKERFDQSVCVEIFKYFAKTAPAYISEMYFPVEQRQVTRRSFNKLRIPNQRTNRGLKILSFLGPKLWNNLPNHLKSSTSVNTFKHNIKKLFFDNLIAKDLNPYLYY